MQLSAEFIKIFNTPIKYMNLWYIFKKTELKNKSNIIKFALRLETYKTLFLEQ